MSELATRPPRRRLFDSELLQNYGLVLIVAVVFAGFAIAKPAMLKLDNITGILSAVAIIGIMAVLSTFVILTGGIDLSVGAIMGLTGLLAQGILTKSNVTALTALALGCGIGALVGLVNGIIVARFELPAIVVTLGSLSIVRGIALLIGNAAQRAVSEPAAYLRIGGGKFLGIPAPVYIFLAVALIGWLIQVRTRFGFSVFAIGENERAARLCGVPVVRTKTLVYVLSGLGAGLAGMVLSSETHTATAVYGTGYELNVIAAVVVGGTSLFGGRGSVLRSVLGAVLIGIINDGLNILNVPIAEQLIAEGLVIVLAIAFDQYVRRER
ncbi:MAG TPA: ABC transporter permease [Acidothermaceae bacterium]|jgi:ribose/xylose/arabinose/galactoside ABC-type transport system permease subunit